MQFINEECLEITKKIDFTTIKNLKILVTGASGLVGLYLINTLKQLKETNNIEIYGWVKSELDKTHINFFEDIKIIKGDICDSNTFVDLPNFDIIIHAAGYGQPGKFLKDKVKTITLNTNSLVNLFSKLNRQGKFMFLSTSELYSGNNSTEIKETEIGNTNTDHPRSCYIEGKRCGESICHSFYENGYDVKIVRLSLAYGPGTKIGDHRVLNSLIEKGLKNDEIKLMDGGDAIRTYCYITDAVEMFFNILIFGKSVTYNVGGESVVTILDLAKTIGEKLNKKVLTPTQETSLDGNPKIVNISIKKYIEEFGKPPFKTLDYGLNNTIKWQKHIYEKNNL